MAILDEVARSKPDLWPVLLEQRDTLNSVARQRAVFWLLAGYSPDHEVPQTQERLRMIEAFVAPDIGGALSENLSMGQMTLLHVGAATGWVSCLEELHKSGVFDVNGLADGQAPLHIACSLGHVEAAAWLLNNGADPELLNDAGMTGFQCHKQSLRTRNPEDAGRLMPLTSRQREEHEKFRLQIGIANGKNLVTAEPRRRL